MAFFGILPITRASRAATTSCTRGPRPTSTSSHSSIICCERAAKGLLRRVELCLGVGKQQNSPGGCPRQRWRDRRGALFPGRGTRVRCRHRPNPVVATKFRFLDADRRVGLRLLSGLRRAAKAQGIDQAKAFPVASCSLAEPELVEIGPEASDGHLSSSVYFESINTPCNRDFVRTLPRCVPDAGPTSADAEASYMAVHLLAGAIQHAQSADMSSVLAALPFVSLWPRKARSISIGLTVTVISHLGSASPNSRGGFSIIYEAPVLYALTPIWSGTRPRRNSATCWIEDRSMSVRDCPKFQRNARRNPPSGRPPSRRLGRNTFQAWPYDSDHGPSRHGCGATPRRPQLTDVLFFDADAPDGLTIANCTTARPPGCHSRNGNSEPISTRVRTRAIGDLAQAASPDRHLYALYFAVNEHHRRQALIARAADLQARHGARRFVIKAVLALAAQHGIDDDQAYRMLRQESMQQRLTVEELAVRMLAGGALSTGRKVMRA